MALSDCEDCKGTGEIETQTILYGQSYMKNGVLGCDVIGKGDWAMTQCPCIGEEDDRGFIKS